MSLSLSLSSQPFAGPIPAPKISILVSDLSSSGAGRWGGAVRPFLLAQALQQIGYPVELVGFTCDGAPAVQSTPELPIKTVVGSTYPSFVQSIQQLRQQIDGDILYAYKPKPSSFGVGLLDRWHTKRPLLLDIDDWELSWHGGDQWRYQPTPKQLFRDLGKANGALRQPDHPLYLGWLERWICQADAITTHTQFLQNRFGGAYVPNGKDVSLFDPQRVTGRSIKQQYGLSDYRILMFPGAPRPYKGVEDVLMALDRLNQPNLRLVIVGGSPYDDYDQQLLSQWGRWIVKLPKIPHHQMPEVIAAADVIVVPQRDSAAAQAQFPLKLTDGMAMAKPILATRVGDIPKILADTGYLVDPGSPDQLATTIEQIFANPTVATQQGQRARQRCIEYCSIETMAANLAQVLATVIPT
ncbi:MAG: glycosyltransferase family 4 protein [Elainella sp. Prado103]|jgi:glycosyltransferase involved in cell wall biosynthesis|nr:glycosyltransferase family 4 protein [Elainella sp. Prado103]